MMQRTLNASIWKLMLILGIDEGEQEVINGADDMGKLECVKQKVFEKAKGKS